MFPPMKFPMLSCRNSNATQTPLEAYHATFGVMWLRSKCKSKCADHLVPTMPSPQTKGLHCPPCCLMENRIAHMAMGNKIPLN